MSTVRRSSTIVCISTNGHSWVEGYAHSQWYTYPWTLQAQANSYRGYAPPTHQGQPDYQFQAARIPFFRPPTLLTLTSIQGLFHAMYHNIYAFQAQRTRNGQSGKTRKSPPKSPSLSSSLAAKSIHATVVIQGRAYLWCVIESRQ